MATVEVVSVCAASGCGKTEFSKLLADQLHSSYLFNMDWWFRHQDLPECELRQHPPGCRCYEAPAAVDIQMFLREFKLVVDRLCAVTDGPLPQVSFETREGRRSLKPKDATAIRTEAPLYVIIEGFKLFAYRELLDLSHHIIWLEADLKTCALGRATRLFNRCRPNQFIFVWQGHDEWKQLMLENAQAYHSKLIYLENRNPGLCDHDLSAHDHGQVTDCSTCGKAIRFGCSICRPVVCVQCSRAKAGGTSLEALVAESMKRMDTTTKIGEPRKGTTEAGDELWRTQSRRKEGPHCVIS